MWQSSGLVYLPCISRRQKRVYRPYSCYNNNTVRNDQLLLKHGACLQRFKGGLHERHFCVENASGGNLNAGVNLKLSHQRPMIFQLVAVTEATDQVPA